jgi:hypothetical protein
MVELEMDFTLSAEELARVQKEAVRRGITPEEMAGILAHNELERRSRCQLSGGAVVPFRRRAD